MKLTINHYHNYPPSVGQEEIIQYLKKISMKQTELAAQMGDLKTTLLKSIGEVHGVVEKLGTALENQENVSPEVETAFGELKTIATNLDNIIPDTSPETPPVEEEPTEDGQPTTEG